MAAPEAPELHIAPELHDSIQKDSMPCLQSDESDDKANDKANLPEFSKDEQPNEEVAVRTSKEADSADVPAAEHDRESREADVSSLGGSAGKSQQPSIISVGEVKESPEEQYFQARQQTSGIWEETEEAARNNGLSTITIDAIRKLGSPMEQRYFKSSTYSHSSSIANWIWQCSHTGC
eukprot:gnl/MRDRNA2_/MRDRNA2_313452_c0_seq1.p1 gnl/MRDRNA2_/MRDRNA2_313452_c0~~gnl/MRDRNA2_/MRDRNA2_313452_c0_seq1.p1  ORF type:complete len:178 (-),score=43.56 gnl/MRDRNA2_/MRDRNA2_313452_c0_seq1:370-903(-)